MALIEALFVLFFVWIAVSRVGPVRKMLADQIQRAVKALASSGKPPSDAGPAPILPCPRCGKPARVQATRWEQDEHQRRTALWRRVVCESCKFDEWMRIVPEVRTP